MYKYGSLSNLVCDPGMTLLTLNSSVSGAACVYACSPTLDPSNGQSASIKNFDSASAELAADVNKEYPNTKVIGYPLDIANEQDTLGLIDDVLNACGRLDVWVCAAGWLGPASIEKTGPRELQRGWEANGLAPFFALRYAPAAMAKLCSKGSYPNAAPKDVAYGSIVVVSSVASTYGGESMTDVHFGNFGNSADVASLGCWGPCFTMSSHAALGVVRAGVAVLKGDLTLLTVPKSFYDIIVPYLTRSNHHRLWCTNQLYLTRSDRHRRRPPGTRHEGYVPATFGLTIARGSERAYRS